MPAISVAPIVTAAAAAAHTADIDNRLDVTQVIFYSNNQSIITHLQGEDYIMDIHTRMKGRRSKRTRNNVDVVSRRRDLGETLKAMGKSSNSKSDKLFLIYCLRKFI